MQFTKRETCVRHCQFKGGRKNIRYCKGICFFFLFGLVFVFCFVDFFVGGLWWVRSSEGWQAQMGNPTWLALERTGAAQRAVRLAD